MYINYEWYKYFLHVAKYNSFTKAAQELSVSQSAVSQSVNKLENMLGYKLFDRVGKKIILNKKGESLLEYLSKGEVFFENAHRHIKYETIKEQKIIFSGSKSLINAFIIPKLNHIKNTNFEFSGEGFSKDKIKKLEEDKIDFVILEELNAFTGKNIDKIHFATLNYGFIYNKNTYQLKNAKLEEILNEPLIIQNTGSKARRLFDDLIINGAEIKNVITAYYEESVIKAVEENLGVGFAPIEYINSNNLDYAQNHIVKVKIHLAYKKHNEKVALLLNKPL